jgi:hypothetical protein
MTARNASAEKKSKYFQLPSPAMEKRSTKAEPTTGHRPIETREDLSHTPSPYYAGAKEQTHRLQDGSLKSSVDEEWERTH